MKTLNRNSRISRADPFGPAKPSNSGAELAPDITTDRARPRPPAIESLPPVAEQMPATHSRNSDTASSILEARHPDIVRAISLLWGFPEMNQYFERLWMADGAHKGPIHPDAMSELMFLSRLHHMIVPQHPGRSLAEIYGSNRLYAPASSAANPWNDVPPRR